METTATAERKPSTSTDDWQRAELERLIRGGTENQLVLLLERARILYGDESTADAGEAEWLPDKSQDWTKLEDGLQVYPPVGARVMAERNQDGAEFGVIVSRTEHGAFVRSDYDNDIFPAAWGREISVYTCGPNGEHDVHELVRDKITRRDAEDAAKKEADQAA